MDLAVSPSAVVGMAVKDVRAGPDIIDGYADMTNAPPPLVPSLYLYSKLSFFVKITVIIAKICTSNGA